MKSQLLSFFFLFLFFNTFHQKAAAQSGDCPYPIIFLHGWNSNGTAFSGVYDDSNFSNLWGGLSDVFYSIQNAGSQTKLEGSDNILGTSDDDVITYFNNETNDLAAGCIYSLNADNDWNEDPNNPILYPDGDGIDFSTQSDSNESSIYKSGILIKNLIEKVLAANPTKSKVILVGHSMGGLFIREYLQRTSAGTPQWWVDPTAADGHKVAKVLTVVTPHGGSNSFGNLFQEEDNPASRDGTPDLNSEAVRDLRYSWSCGLGGFFSCPGAYLYGGEEDAGWGWSNEDVNCDGDESDNSINGININGTSQGFSDEWDGTKDNPSMPLPTNVHYTYLTSNGFSFAGLVGDGVVAQERQWLYDGSVPQPSDVVSGRLADTILVDRFHTTANTIPEEVIRGLDEGDYPFFAYEIKTDIDYTMTLNFRPTNSPNTASTDVDYFKFSTPVAFGTSPLSVDLTAHPTRDITVDYFQNVPSDYESFTSTATLSQTFAAGSGFQTMFIPAVLVNNGSTAFVRMRATNVDMNDWQDPVVFKINFSTVLDVELDDFYGEVDDKNIDLFWSTISEKNFEKFEIERSKNGLIFQKILEKRAFGNSSELQKYQATDDNSFLGNNYYRLKLLDEDGSYEYSKVIIITRENNAFEISKTYPNPVKDILFIDLESAENTDIQWNMSDALGRQILNGIQGLDKGKNQLNWNISSFPSGFYFIKLEVQGTSEIVKVFVN